ncbi:MAG: efflux RND transporter periplasmic adaptor subunit [Candidatus Thiodiazotropha sp.]|nr:efflux RND transporter periplasmic adaptor subunit [Candidatus Thiodiazotropha sp.]MCM8882406.1 efflux RND transporter periplasmic adaptor subunit [Candidatus Thiodiazotropha sp.]MCM8919899.1 efflux RND transporter periplasmic adaptor subunit [Candidatus Thiodiazotropha sp.]
MQWAAYQLTGLILFSLILMGCEKPQPLQLADIVRPVKTYLIETADSGGVRSFPARIDAGRKAELSFRVSGKVNTLSVKEGDRVEKGQQLATLDTTDYRITFNDRKASLDNAKKNFTRAKELIVKGNISKMDFDRLEAEFKSAQSALESAQQNLKYTKLSAPFKGIIAKRHIENFEEIQAKQIVLDLQDITQLEVKFDIPESQLRELQPEGDMPDSRRTQIPVKVTFSDLPGKSYPLTYREVSTKADTKTQTFQVTYTMDKTDDVTILPGMTATAIVDLSEFLSTGIRHTVPAQAIIGDYKLDPKAWVIDEQSMTVKSRSVKVGRLLGNHIEVLEGLEPGERIVTAGAPFVVENMPIKLMPDQEQAEPRTEDLKYQ